MIINGLNNTISIDKISIGMFFFLESRNDLKQKRQVRESHKSDVLSLQFKSAKMNAVEM